MTHLPPRPALLLGAVLLGGLLAGCGLSEYEKQMEFQQKRIDYLDDENKVLEPQPLNLPPLKDGTKIIVPNNYFFFRPPKGISCRPAERLLGNILYEFGPTATQKVPITMIWAAIAKADPDNTKDSFQDDVKRVLKITGKKTTVPVRTPVRKQVILEMFETSTPTEVTRAYFNKQDPLCEAVVVIRMPPDAANHQIVTSAVEKALGTFLTGNLAFNQHHTRSPIAPGGGVKDFPTRGMLAK